MTVKTLISYSHESGLHEERVLSLADQLVADGIDARIDQYLAGPPTEGWPRWAELQVEGCQFVVMVFTPTYRSRYERAQTQQTAEPDERATWETMLARHLLYTAGGRNTKLVPVMFEGTADELVPLALRAWNAYPLPGGYEDLLRHLLGRPKFARPPLGPTRKLAPAPRPSFMDITRPKAAAMADSSEDASTTLPPERPAVAPRPEAPSVPLATPACLTLPPPSDRRVTIVVFTANGAVSRPRLRLAKELRAIRLALNAPHLQHRFRLEVCTMASFSDVVRELDVHEPAFVHFSGHTDPVSGHLILESEQEGDEVFISPQQIADLLAELDRAPTLVTFTACCSTKLAVAAAAHAGHAIGFEDEYYDDWAPLFSGTLYERLTSQTRLDVPRALRMTKLAWQSEGQDVAGQSRLYTGPAPEERDEPNSSSAHTEPAASSAEVEHAAEPIAVDVLIITAIKEELDALLSVTEGLVGPWTREDGDPPRHFATFEGKHGLLRLVAVRQTQMGGVATATTTLPLLDTLKPRSLAMCGVCAGEPEDTDRGDVVIADRVFQYDHGKSKEGGFQGDLWVNAMHEHWLHVAQDLAGPAQRFQGYAPADETQARWWFLEQLRDGRSPLHSSAMRRYFPDARRVAMLESLGSRGDVTEHDGRFSLTESGRLAIESHLAVHDALVERAPYHVHVAPMGSGNAVVADGEVWRRLAGGGMRKAVAVEMEVATIGELARTRSLPFAVAKGVMDHGDSHKTDRFKAFAARAAAEVLCGLLRQVLVPTLAAVEAP